jgi:hypothetical protein
MWTLPRLPCFVATGGILLLSLGGCSSLLTEGSSAGAGIAAAGVSRAFTKNGAITAGIGVGAQAAARASVQYLEKRVHRSEQDEIARVAGELKLGGVAPWSISHSLPIEPDNHGEVTVSRVIATVTTGREPTGMNCKEIVFSVDTDEDHEPTRAFYTAAICLDRNQWKWATAEPATERWGTLQ